jgi:hypothetical protein
MVDQARSNDGRTVNGEKGLPVVDVLTPSLSWILGWKRLNRGDASCRNVRPMARQGKGCGGAWDMCLQRQIQNLASC